jgi:hypothetical protein
MSPREDGCASLDLAERVLVVNGSSPGPDPADIPMTSGFRESRN